MLLRIKCLIFILLMIVSITSCEDDSFTEGSFEINHFIYENMNLYYYWNDKMPNLNMLKQKNSEQYFYDLLYDKVDRWSFITDDVVTLENYFSGIQKQFGFSIRGYYAYDVGNDLVAMVEYVEPGGPADKAGIMRGDMIVENNEQGLNVDNFNDLYYSDRLSVKLGTYIEGRIEYLDPAINLVSEEIQIHPVLVDTVFENNGSKVGYLAYTSFISEFDDQLNDVFGDFKSAGVSDLILDLRYNGGGSVSTAKLMAGLIGPATLEGELFIRSDYNDELTRTLNKQFPNQPELFIDNFEHYPNNLNLSRLFVLTSPGTASASEMVIYSLMPYMDVQIIGEQTHGKYYASTTISDKENHSWAIQPIIMRAENKDNSINYEVGLIPDEEVRDDYTFDLGTQDDVLTAIALDKIWGTNHALQSLKSVKTNPARMVKGLDDLIPFKYEMYLNFDLNK